MSKRAPYINQYIESVQAKVVGVFILAGMAIGCLIAFMVFPESMYPSIRAILYAGSSILVLILAELAINTYTFINKIIEDNRLLSQQKESEPNDQKIR